MLLLEARTLRRAARTATSDSKDPRTVNAEIRELIEMRNANVQRLSARSEEHTSELQSQSNLVCRLLLEKKKNNTTPQPTCRDSMLNHIRTHTSQDRHTNRI